MKRRNCVGTSTLPASYYKDLLPKFQIPRRKYPIKKTGGAVKTPPDVGRFRDEDYFFRPSAMAACAAASRAIGTRNGLQET